MQSRNEVKVRLGMHGKIEITNSANKLYFYNQQKQIEPPHPFVQPPPPVQAAHPPGSNMFNPALYNPTMAAVAAEQQSRFYR